MKKYLIILSIIFIIILISIFKQKTIQVNRELEKEIICELLDSAKLHYNKQELDQALNLYNKITSLDTTIGEVYYNRGYCYTKLEQPNKANRDYERSIKLNYKASNSFFNAGCNYAILYKDSLALECFKNAYILNPNDKQAKLRIEHLTFKLSL